MMPGGKRIGCLVSQSDHDHITEIRPDLLMICMYDSVELMDLAMTRRLLPSASLVVMMCHPDDEPFFMRGHGTVLGP